MAALVVGLAVPQRAVAAGLVVYSRLDFVPAVVRGFTRESGIAVRVRRPPAFGLQSRIIAEGQHPRWTLAWFDGASNADHLDRRGLLARHLPQPAGLSAVAAGVTSADGAYVPTGIGIAGVLVMAKSAPFAPPATWRDLTDPAYHGLIGMNDPATSEQGFGAIASMLHAAGGWPAGQAYFAALKADGLHIYRDTATTLAALRSGAIQIAIVRSSAGLHYSVDLDRSLRVVVPQPASELPSVIVMARHLSKAQRRDALRFIAYVNSPAAVGIALRQGGDDAPFWPAVSAMAAPATMPDFASVSPVSLDAARLASVQPAIVAWFVRSIVGPST
ncbi:ABC transporter substrate-binding protein [Acidiphilium sp.]|uniref:ABC transporter substrate-binding protein n=1 Tax=Acidiphilium sp. TaxID=527 RepID=UPI003D030B48